MNKQFDFLQLEELLVILASWKRFLFISSSKRIILLNLLFLIFFLSGVKETIGQTISISPNPAPANVCADVPQLLSVTPSNVPIVWREVNNNGVFTDASSPNSSSIKYTPNQTTGNTRNDIIIASLDEGYPAKWENVVGIDTTNGNFVCTVNGQGNSGARSQNDLPANTSGWVEAKYGAAVQSVFGLSVALTGHSNDPNTIDFGIQVSTAAQNKAFVIENGTFPSNAPSINLVSGNDIFRVERIGNTIVYKHNRVIFYTSTITTNLALNVDVSMFNSGDAMDIDVSFGDNTHVFPADTITLNVLKIPTIDIGPDVEICEGDKPQLSLNFNGSLFDNWEHTNGSVDVNTLVYTHNTLVSGDRVDKVIAHTLAAPNGVCPAVSDTAEITIRQAPTISLPTLSSSSICEEDSVLVTATPAGNADSIFWTTNMGTFNITNGITDISNSNIRYFPNSGLTSATRVDKLFLETDSDVSVCPTAKDTIDINVHWADSIYNDFALVEICEGDSVEMKAIRAKGAIGNSFTWSILHTTGVFSSTTTATDSNAIYIPNNVNQGDSVRFDTLLVTTTPTGTPTCNAFVDTVVVKVFEVDEVVNSFATFAICEGDSVEMNVTLSGATEKILWTIHDGVGSFIDPDSTDAIYIPADITNNDLLRYDTLFVTSIPTGSCRPAVDTVVVALNRVGQITLSQDTTICLRDAALLRSLSNTTQIDNINTWQRVVNGSNAPLTDQQPNDTIQYNFIDNSNFTFPTLSRIDTVIALTEVPTLTNTSTSANQTCVAATDTVLVTIIDTADITILTSPLILCEEDTSSVKASIVSGALGVTWKVYKGPGTITTLDSVTARYMPSDIASNTQTNRLDTLMAISFGIAGCPPDTAYLAVEVRNAPKLSPVSDEVLCNTLNKRLVTTLKGPTQIKNWEVIPAANGAFSAN